MPRHILVLAHERALPHVCSTSACVRACNSVPPISPYTFQRGDERKRGSYGEPLPRSLSPLVSLHPFALSYPFLFSLFLSPSLCPSTSLSLCRSLCHRVVCAASRVRIRAHIRRRTPTRLWLDTRMRYAFLVGCIFQDCGHSYSAPCNMHTVEGADCSVRSLRVQRARA